MGCARILLKNIGLVVLLVVGVVVGGAALVFVSFASAWAFGWIDTPLPTLAFGLLYMAIGAGGMIGWDECRNG